MSRNVRDAYLEAQVRTATPQRLRLMLIEGAMRFARRSLELWDDAAQREACRGALSRCRGIVSELCATIKTDGFPVAHQVKAIYLFLFQQLADASFSHDAGKVRDVLSVLEEERETWQQLCMQMPEPPARDRSSVPLGCQEITAPHVPISPAPDRFSLEA
ncbi:MAG: flagellar export chaperone FliS [Planctomycetaceae bacterium]|nr:flagellar export chaperone FliS [Planctomycetaceae bacterium]